jgi:hypothetical protein
MAYSRCDGAVWGPLSSDYHQMEEGAKDHLCAQCRQTMLEEEAAKRPAHWDLYAGQYADHLEHFYPSTLQVRSCGDEPVVLVRLTLAEDGPYWGWYFSYHPSNRSSKGIVSFIYRRDFLVDMCFPYGAAAEARRGTGSIVRLSAEILRPAVHPEGI